jgi:hypothetical protein
VPDADVPTLTAPARAVRAEALVRALQIDHERLEGVLVDRESELERLQRVVERQAAQLSKLREQLHDLERQARQVEVETLIGSIASAIAAGERALLGRTISSARAEIRAGLQAAADGTGLVLAPPGAYDTSALSTITFDMRAVPAEPAQEARASALVALVQAIVELQTVLDREHPPAAQEPADKALGQTAALLGDPELSLDTAAAKLRSLVRQLSELAKAQPDLRPSALAVAEQHAALTEFARPDTLLSFADALSALAQELERLRP